MLELRSRFNVNNTIVILNHSAGDGAAKSIGKELESIGYPVYCALKNIPEAVLQTITNKLVVIGGGDGTIHHIINQLYKHNLHNKVRFAILPLGTGNDLARSLGFSKSVILKKLQEQSFNSAQFTELPLWKMTCSHHNEIIEEKVFTNYFSVGFDAKVQADVNKWRKKFPTARFITYLCYGLAGGKHFFYRLPKNSILINGRKKQVLAKLSCVVLTNINSYAGGICLSSANNISAPSLTISRIHSPMQLFSLWLQRSKKHKNFYSQESGNEFHLQGLNLIINIDGEVIRTRSFKEDIGITLQSKLYFLKYSHEQFI